MAAERSRGALAVVIALACLVVPAVALGAFPGTDPNESVRSNAPDDPAFDRCEPDNAGGPTCTNPFDQEFERFGFAPNGSQTTALYNPGAAPARQVAQNTAAGRNPLGQVAGVSADRAWKYFGQAGGAPVGDPEVEVAILDTGIRWDNADLRRKVWLNTAELPVPQDADGNPCGGDDCDADGAFTVDDYADDPSVDPGEGHDEADTVLDASDLIAEFSDGVDGLTGSPEDNGYVDDIAGWDFFDDDNTPYDASSYSSASNHGTGRAEEAAAETDNGEGGTGVCPACRVVPMRVWDTFVVDTNNFAQAVTYAADNGIEVVEGAVGGLINSRFARDAFAYAYEQGTLPVIVSSDLNTANHNWPTTYDQSLFVAGTVADVHGLGSNPPAEFIEFFNDRGVPLSTSAPIQTWFRNSGTTQYGGHAHIVMPAVTGSQATGQASGAAALIASYALRRLDQAQLSGGPLAPNEIKQLLTLTAEDVHPLNTLGLGVPDPAQVGWDQHFGYGRPDLGLALERIRDGEIPPQALITAPDWFAPLNLARQDEVEIDAELSAHRASLVGGERYDWQLQWAPGIEPCESDFVTVASGSGADARSGPLGSIDLEQVRAALDARTASSACPGPPQPVTGGSTFDPTAPAKGPGDVDPNEPAFTVRVVVTDTEGNRAEDRKLLFAYRDDSLAGGWARPVGGEADAGGEAEGAGEASQRMYDLDGDNRLEIVEATSSGELHVLGADGTPSPSFNGGQPVSTQLYPNVHEDAPAYAQVVPPQESLRVPAIGDIDGDLEPEIVDSAGEHVYAWERDGSVVAGFPVRLDPALSEVSDRTRVNHIKRGFMASPTLADLDGGGDLEIVVPALDQHVYAFKGDGSPLPGFPAYLRERDANGDPIPCAEDFECAEIINTAAVGDITGDGVPEIVVPTAEFDDDAAAPDPPAGFGGFGGVLTNVLANVLGGSSRIYALDAQGEILPGWPVKPNGIVPDALPLVGPGVDQVLGDVDDDGTLEVVGNIATGDVTAYESNGSTATEYDSEPQGGEHVDKSRVLNLFENPVVADFDGLPGIEVLKGGVTLNGLVNVGVAVGQNLAYNHVMQAWNGQTGASLPSFPQAVEDYQLLSSPAVADVSDAVGTEAIVGTGLYLVRNLNALGDEGTGWPKFTGGWNFAVPTIGDADADGDLEVATMTREGFSFLWETGADACAGNSEWWTSRHDEWSTGAYGTDSRPPGTARGLSAIRSPDGSLQLSWVAPGDDWLCGDAERFRVLVGNGPIEHPGDGTVVAESDASAAAGESQSATLTAAEAGAATHFGVLYRDDAGNWGLVADAPIPAAESGEATDDGAAAGDGGGGDGSSGPSGGICAKHLLGTKGKDNLRGTPASELLRGRAGKDKLSGGGGDDCLNGGRGQDRVRGGAGDDEIRARRGGRDRVSCGPGEDVAFVNPKRDRVNKTCEKLRT